MLLLFYITKNKNKKNSESLHASYTLCGSQNAHAEPLQGLYTHGDKLNGLSEPLQTSYTLTVIKTDSPIFT